MTRILARRLAVLLAAMLSCTAALAAASPGAGSAAAGLAPAAAPARLTGQRVAAPGTNLLLNPGAQTGAASAQGWDEITIPGWLVAGTYAGQVMLVDTATQKVTAKITVGTYPVAVAVAG